MAMVYDPVSDLFQVYQPAKVEKVELKMPSLYDEPFDISSWASRVTDEGVPVPKNNLTEDLRNPMVENSEQETYIETPNAEVNLEPTKKTITSTQQKKNALAIMNSLVKRGYQPHVAAGIVGNLMAESGLNPANYVKSDVGKPGGGLAAWRDDLFRNLQNSAKSQNIPWTNIDFQLNYLHNLLNQNNTQMNEVRDKLNKAKTPYEASEAWAYYEKYAGYNHSLASAKSWQKQNKWTDAQTQKWIKDEHAKRGGFAKEFYELWKNQKA